MSPEARKEYKDLVFMEVSGLTIDPFTSMPIVILKDPDEKYALPIWIGLIEASAIATELENIPLSRPMTHDLFKSVLEETGVSLKKVILHDIADNTFYAHMIFVKSGKEFTMDSRPSDAMALSLRMKAPIYVEKGVIEKSRKIDLSKETLDKEGIKKHKWAEILENLSPEDFGKYKM